MSKFHALYLIVSYFFIIADYKLLAASIAGQVTIKAKSSGKWEPTNKNQNAVIFLKGENLSKSKKLKPMQINMKNGHFSARVVPVEVGQTVYFKNTDNIYHNVWSLSKAKQFDLGSYKAPLKKKVTFDRPGLIKIFCNIHPEMIMTILVLKNKYFLKTKRNGKFSFKDIPPGKYEVRAWVEGSKPQVKKVDLSSVAKTSVDFTLKQKLITHHLDKNKKPYKKY